MRQPLIKRRQTAPPVHKHPTPVHVSLEPLHKDDAVSGDAWASNGGLGAVAPSGDDQKGGNPTGSYGVGAFKSSGIEGTANAMAYNGVQPGLPPGP